MADPALPDAVLPVRVAFFCEGVDAPLDPRAYHGTEELGEPTRFDIEVSPADVVGWEVSCCP